MWRPWWRLWATCSTCFRYPAGTTSEGWNIDTAQDFFALLGESRRPWLDGGKLKDKFHALTALHHPDVAVDGSDFQALNAAYQALREPRTRLRHLLELEGALTTGTDTLPDFAALFMKIGALRQGLAAFRLRRESASTPLAQAVLAPERLRLNKVCDECLAALRARTDELLEELRAVDETWPEQKSLGRLGALYESFSYLSKWSDQAREASLILNL